MDLDPEEILLAILVGPESLNRATGAKLMLSIVARNLAELSALGQLKEAIEDELGPEKDWTTETVEGVMRHMLSIVELVVIDTKFDDPEYEASFEKTRQSTLKKLAKIRRDFKL